MRNWKKVMAAAMAATMLMGNTIPVFADDVAEGSGTGTGEVEGVITTDIFQVKVPTDAGTVFNFKMDPQQLIKKTNEGKYGDGSTALYADDATIFFKNANTDDDGTDDTYSATSDQITAINKSTMKVDISVSATITDATGITLTTDNTFADDTSASMYMALVGNDGTADTTVAIDDDGAELTSTIDATADVYSAKWVAEATDPDTSETIPAHYEYVLDSSITDDDFESYTFKLTGACNTAGDWSALAEAAPKVNVVWSVQPYQGQLPTFETGDALGQIKITSEGDGQNALASITKIEMTNENGTFDGYNANAAYKYDGATKENDVIEFASNYLSFYTAKEEYEAKITYVNVAGETKVVTVMVTTSTGSN